MSEILIFPSGTDSAALNIYINRRYTIFHFKGNNYEFSISFKDSLAWHLDPCEPGPALAEADGHDRDFVLVDRLVSIEIEQRIDKPDFLIIVPISHDRHSTKNLIDADSSMIPLLYLVLLYHGIQQGHGAHVLLDLLLHLAHCQRSAHHLLELCLGLVVSEPAHHLLRIEVLGKLG